jgi:hypothetical protein
MNDGDDAMRAGGSAPAAGGGTPRSSLECLRCGQPIESQGVHEFRTGGSTGAAHLLFGQWAELGEEKLSFEIFACPACRHVELRLPG